LLLRFYVQRRIIVSSTKRAAIILAAGKSTRMKSARSKVLHELGGQSLLAWVTKQALSVGAEKIIAVVGPDNEDVKQAALGLGLEIAVQHDQSGTANAVQAAQDHLQGFDGDVIVLYGDTPLTTTASLKSAFETLEQGAAVCVLGFEPEDPLAYGRLIIKDGVLEKIVEAKDASPDELKVRLCNSGVMAASVADMFGALSQVGNDNAKGEYYLTDVVGILRSQGKTGAAVVADEDELLGVDSRAILALAEQAFQSKMRAHMMDAGVTLRDPSTTYFSWDTVIAADVDIGANVVFGPGVEVLTGAVIHPFCHIEGAKIGENVQIGPFARLRPGAEMDTNSKAGNFVEIKKSTIGKGSKINHLSYIGDAEIAENVNVGAGTITCNYDGYFKHKTIIGAGAFIGTNSCLVAPITIGSGAFLATGGVITKDVPDNALALARAEQANKDGWATRYHTTQKKRKQKRAKNTKKDVS
jgi:bifunctional UDP-N-acetylglucosamine pyrophosphorylase/glucosamine-1-phosphate N-acetyltransferase